VQPPILIARKCLAYFTGVSNAFCLFELEHVMFHLFATWVFRKTTSSHSHIIRMNSLTVEHHQIESIPFHSITLFNRLNAHFTGFTAFFAKCSKCNKPSKDKVKHIHWWWNITHFFFIVILHCVCACVYTAWPKRMLYVWQQFFWP